MNKLSRVPNCFVIIREWSPFSVMEDDDSDPQAEEVSLPYRPEHRQPLSGGAIFGLVVLGVIVAILLMSIF